MVAWPVRDAVQCRNRTIVACFVIDSILPEAIRHSGVDAAFMGLSKTHVIALDRGSVGGLVYI